MSKLYLHINPILEIEINNVISKINAKQAEASRTSAHPITSLTNPSLIRAE